MLDCFRSPRKAQLNRLCERLQKLNLTSKGYGDLSAFWHAVKPFLTLYPDWTNDEIMQISIGWEALSDRDAASLLGMGMPLNWCLFHTALCMNDIAYLLEGRNHVHRYCVRHLWRRPDHLEFLYAWIHRFPQDINTLTPLPEYECVQRFTTPLQEAWKKRNLGGVILLLHAKADANVSLLLDRHGPMADTLCTTTTFQEFLWKPESRLTYDVPWTVTTVYQTLVHFSLSHCVYYCDGRGQTPIDTLHKGSLGWKTLLMELEIYHLQSLHDLLCLYSSLDPNTIGLVLTFLMATCPQVPVQRLLKHESKYMFLV